MHVSRLPGCCTSIFFACFNTGIMVPTHALNYLKSGLLNEMRACRTNDDDLLDHSIMMYITTQSQENDPNLMKFLEKMSFKKVYTSAKDTSKSRHKETGPLSTWCTTPLEFKEARLAWIKELEEELKPKKKIIYEEELLRRMEFPAFQFSKMGRALGFNTVVGPVYVPFFGGNRTVVINYVKEVTGGFDILLDPVLIDHLATSKNFTYSQLKERCLLYRKGEI